MLPNRYLTVILVSLIANISQSQIKKEYDFPGQYNRETAQGMAIHKNTAFLLNDKGYCRIYDLKKKTLTAQFFLASAGEMNHANCASFGVDYPDNNKKYPALYISACKEPYCCFVESIDENGSQLIQTLRISTVGRQERYSLNWYLDQKQKCLYTISTPYKDIDSAGTKKFLITKLPLPPLDSAEVVFTEKDFLDQFEIAFPNVLQGGIVHKNYLYLPVGLHPFPGSELRKDKKRAVIVVDLKQKQIEKTIDIEADVTNEPEDVDFYRNKLLLYCGQDGGLYKIPVKNKRR